ncbi:hypothetical protein PTTG_29052 [Puccinia triticina 1-1 BBBD Race 1]|uniref:Uncharacterized protein n=1 Tax=Puccinia triticina (isolate 1-1 / race 1 (BBBD)) TaxID=630390 RepID=A0A180G6S6_PUCT1|nr:hypothetical protein PTTG_29052 [Puccinia triticina 1-1 BBBD Race 1]
MISHVKHRQASHPIQSPPRQPFLQPLVGRFSQQRTPICIIQWVSGPTLWTPTFTPFERPSRACRFQIFNRFLDVQFRGSLLLDRSAFTRKQEVKDPDTYENRGRPAELWREDSAFMINLVRLGPGLFLEICEKLYDSTEVLLSSHSPEPR